MSKELELVINNELINCFALDVVNNEALIVVTKPSIENYKQGKGFLYLKTFKIDKLIINAKGELDMELIDCAETSNKYAGKQKKFLDKLVKELPLTTAS